jgi:general secretion pathway protein H
MMMKHNGFTLIELLIVILIISIVAAVATITISSNHRKDYEMFALQLVNTFKLAEQEAMLRPATLGFNLSRHAYHFSAFQFNKKSKKLAWDSLDEPTLSSHPIPSHIYLTLEINKENVIADGKPCIIISPSNELTPFIILIGKKGETPYYRVTGKENGEVNSEAVNQE